MESIFKDIRYGVRGLIKRPAFTIIAVATLALGIGANAAIFSVVDAVLLKPLRFKDPEKLMMIWEEASFAGFPRNTPAPANFVDWKNQNHTFEDMAAIAEASYNVTGDGEPERVSSSCVSANFFPLLGVQPVLGRSFSAEEDQPGNDKVVILSHSLWQSRYGGKSEILNSNIHLDGEKYTVIGIMPAGFQFIDQEVRLWVPLALDAKQMANRGGHFLTIVGRLKAGATASQAQADMTAVMSRISADHPNETFDGKLGVVVLPLREQLAGDSRRPLYVLLVAVGFVLLIACANIASLMLARAAGRRREMAVRKALGASRWQIVRQLLIESVLLSMIGGLIGVALAYLSFSFFERLIPEGLRQSVDLKLDGYVILFALAVSLVTGILFGLIPALQSARTDLSEALKQSGGRSASGSASWLRSGMIVFEVSLSIVLLVGAGLLIQTLFQLFRQYSVLSPEKVLTVRTVLPESKYSTVAKRSAFYESVLGRLQNTPGVISAGYTTTVPLSWKGGTSGFFPEGTKEPLPGMAYDANHRQLSAKYLQTMNVPLRQGRYFDDNDNEQSQKVAIINETMARQYWPGENVMGRRFKLGDPADDVPWLTIVGVVADIRQMGLDAPVKAEMYFPYKQDTDFSSYIPRDLVVRTSGNPLDMVTTIRQLVREADPDQPISNVTTMDDVLGQETAQRRLGMILLSSFALLALLLACLGIYGVLSYFVTQHRSEIGVRLALGAAPGQILLLVIRKGMVLTALGALIGLGASFALTRLMSSLLFEVKAADPLTFVSVPVVLAIVAFLACWIPARRASKVDPMIALRYE